MNFTSSLNQMKQMLGALQNPQGYINQQMVQQLIKENPGAWQQVQNMFKGKSHKQQVSMLRELYKKSGLDLDAIATQYGVAL